MQSPHHFFLSRSIPGWTNSRIYYTFVPITASFFSVIHYVSLSQYLSSASIFCIIYKMLYNTIAWRKAFVYFCCYFHLLRFMIHLIGLNRKSDKIIKSIKLWKIYTRKIVPLLQNVLSRWSFTFADNFRLFYGLTNPRDSQKTKFSPKNGQLNEDKAVLELFAFSVYVESIEFLYRLERRYSIEWIEKLVNEYTFM